MLIQNDFLKAKRLEKRPIFEPVWRPIRPARKWCANWPFYGHGTAMAGVQKRLACTRTRLGI
jgi:hypothetical protein